MKISMCIAGCGGYAKKVLNDIHDMTDEFDLYFASRDINKASEYNDTYNGKGFFGSYEDAAADPRIQALYFLTPHHTHLDDAFMAASHKKHILIEKPIARTVDESTKMIDAAKTAGVKLMVAENYRFLPTVEKCKDILASGNLGDLRLVQVQSESYGASTDWRTNAEQNGGGVFIDGGIHFVDVVMNIGGFPKDVYASTPKQVFKGGQGEDGMVMMANLPNGAVGLINQSRATERRVGTQWVSITGTKGQLTFEPYSNKVTIDTVRARHTLSLPDAHRGVRGMVSEFRNSIVEDREPVMSGEEALRDLEIVLAAYKSALTGATVSLG